jgi:GTP pyrophosphokinase
MTLNNASKIQFFFEKSINFECRINKAKDESVILKTIDYIENIVNQRNQKSKEDVLEIAFSTAEIAVFEAGGGINTLISTLLFYGLSANEIEIEEIGKIFSPTVGEIVAGLQKIPVFKTEKFNTQAENFINLLLSISGDARSVLIRLCRQIYDMRNLTQKTEEEQKILSHQTAKLFAPLAHRLGLYKIKTELEEVSMKNTEREMFKFIAGKLNESKIVRDLYIKNFIEPLKINLKNENFDFEIKGRPKSIFSIWKKMQKQGVSFEEVYDLFAIRIILNTATENEKSECWRAYSVVTNFYKPNPKRLRDWVSSPKISGYESLHTTVLGPENKWIEVQIRTKRMDEIAEKGTAAHWKYKGNEKTEHDEWLAKMREALENKGKETETDNDDAKSSLYSGEYFIFTPDGDLKKIRPGYTVLDFAFLIHSKIGETCTGSVIDGKIKPISYELKNGETVKILTSKSQKPNVGWLKMVKGSKTIVKIKRILNSIEYKDSSEGKEMLKSKLKQLKIEFNDLNIKKICEYFNFENPILFYQSLGEGKADIQKIKKVFENQQVEIISEHYEPVPEKPKPIRSKSDEYLLIGDNLTTLDYQFAKCCNPIPGDEIFGFVSVLKGTRIHKANCPNAIDLKSKYGYRIVKAKWNVKNPDSAFVSTLKLEGKDSPGISSVITTIISKEFDINIQKISLSVQKSRMFKGSVTILVKNRIQFLQVMERLKKVKDVLTVTEKI